MNNNDLDLLDETDNIVKQLQAAQSDPHNSTTIIDLLARALNEIDWLEKGNDEWREACVKHSHEAMRFRAQAKIALAHLDKVLNGCHNADEQMQADSAARLWLESIGYEQK
jgi:hypothetical protein